MIIIFWSFVGIGVLVVGVKILMFVLQIVKEEDF